jgi:hypothetical protein
VFGLQNCRRTLEHAETPHRLICDKAPYATFSSIRDPAKGAHLVSVQHSRRPLGQRHVKIAGSPNLGIGRRRRYRDGGAGGSRSDRHRYSLTGRDGGGDDFEIGPTLVLSSAKRRRLLLPARHRWSAAAAVHCAAGLRGPSGQWRGPSSRTGSAVAARRLR